MIKQTVPLSSLVEQATPVPWSLNLNGSENEDGTTCSESVANRKLARHSVNALPTLLWQLRTAKARLEICLGRMEACHAKYPAEHQISVREIPDWITEMDAQIAKVQLVVFEIED
jgi:hypothetical protein